MCKNMKVACGGFSNYYCNDCSEDVALEFELDEISGEEDEERESRPLNGRR